MYNANCDICGHAGKGLFQIFIRSLDDPTIETEQKCLCGSCIQKLFQADPEKTGPEKQEQANPENDHMKGLRVNAFLRTPFYLNGKDFRFINLEQHEIMNLKPYIRHTVLHVSEPHPKTGIITVMVE